MSIATKGTKRIKNWICGGIRFISSEMSIHTYAQIFRKWSQFRHTNDIYFVRSVSFPYSLFSRVSCAFWTFASNLVFFGFFPFLEKLDSNFTMCAHTNTGMKCNNLRYILCSGVKWTKKKKKTEVKCSRNDIIVCTKKRNVQFVANSLVAFDAGSIHLWNACYILPSNFDRRIR